MQHLANIFAAMVRTASGVRFGACVQGPIYDFTFKELIVAPRSSLQGVELKGLRIRLE